MIGKQEYKIGDKVELNRNMSYDEEHTTFLKQNNYMGIVESIVESPQGECWHYKMEGYDGYWAGSIIGICNESQILEEPIKSRFDILDL